jgi:hypothetical protein
MQAQNFGDERALDPTREAEHQLDLVRSAIALLASGGARRVTLVNLAVNEGTLREAGGLARAAGMLLRIASHGVASDITVEASG